MDAFGRALAFTLRWEGGYVNHPNDPGGETYRGITRKNHPDWSGWEVVDRLQPEMRGLLDDDPGLDESVADFYREHYWDKAHCDEIAQIAPLTAEAVFDMAVHSGVSAAVKQLQNDVGAVMDGVFGPQSERQMRSHMDRFLARGHVTKRTDFLKRLITKNSKLKVFEKGWLNRMDALVESIQQR